MVAHPPRHRVVALALLQRIRGGEWPLGGALPAELELAKAYAVGRSTVREAMRSLESLGWVERRRGAGTFVRQREAPEAGRIFVGLVVAHLDDIRLAGTLGGLEEVLHDAGVRLEVRATHDLPEAETMAVEALRREGAAGVLLEPAPGWPSRPYLRRCLAEGFPVACLDRYDPEVPLPHAAADQRQGALHLARHLLAGGHRRIAFIIPRSFPTTAIAQRIDGYTRALAEAGVAQEPRLLVRLQGALQEPVDDALRTAINGLMALRDSERPTAWMCPNDEVAAWVLSLLKEAGVHVPEECSVTGFDDLPYARRLDPPLTTAQQPLDAIGRAAAEGLLLALRDPSAPPAQITLPVRLVVRGSTTRAPHAVRAASAERPGA